MPLENKNTERLIFWLMCTAVAAALGMGHYTIAETQNRITVNSAIIAGQGKEVVAVSTQIVEINRRLTRIEDKLDLLLKEK